MPARSVTGVTGNGKFTLSTALCMAASAAWAFIAAVKLLVAHRAVGRSEGTIPKGYL